jgi:hypothetical protein
MGMFDYIACYYPLPDGEDGAGMEFQTKDTDSQYLDRYEIRADGTLFDTTNKGSHYGKGNVSFKKCNAQILASSVDVSLGKTTLATQSFKGAG